MLPMVSTCMRGLGNPGDTFIGIGGQYLLEKAFNRTINWFNISKFEDEEYYTKMNSVLDGSKCIYYAGTPQYQNYDAWSNYMDTKFWTDHIDRTNVKVVSIAGGGGYPDPDITPEEFSKWCLESQKTVDLLEVRKKHLALVTVRDKFAHQMLTDAGIDNYYLPCTAMWATRAINIKNSTQEEILFVPPGTTLISPSDWSALTNSMIEVAKEFGPKERIRFICHGKEEYLFFSSLGFNTVFTEDFLFLLKAYSKAKIVISARLHGAFPAFGAIGTKVVSIAIDIRGRSTEIIPSISTISFREATKNGIIDALGRAKRSSNKDLDYWEKEYIKLICGCEPLAKQIGEIE